MWIAVVWRCSVCTSDRCGHAQNNRRQEATNERLCRVHFVCDSLHHLISAYDHITANLPDTIGTRKSNVVELAEYSGGGPRGKCKCCMLFVAATRSIPKQVERQKLSTCCQLVSLLHVHSSSHSSPNSLSSHIHRPPGRCIGVALIRHSYYASTSPITAADCPSHTASLDYHPHHSLLPTFNRPVTSLLYLTPSMSSSSSEVGRRLSTLFSYTHLPERHD